LASNQTEPKWILFVEWVALITIVALAAYLRYWRIGEIPPGFNSDEAVGAMGAMTTLREGFKYSYEGQGGGGALGFYFAAASFYLFGPSIAAIRGVAAWAGVVSIFANYWAIREVFRITSLNRARWIAGLSTLGLAVSLWHVSASRIAFAGIGVPFLMLPSVYFLWLGLNKKTFTNPQLPIQNLKFVWPFITSGVFLGGLMYIYLSGVFFPPFYAAFFIGQWLLVKLAQKLNLVPEPAETYMTTKFWQLFATGLTTVILLLPIIYVLLVRAELEPGTTRASQAFILNPQINQGDPWGLLWRSIAGNFGAYGVSLSWFIGQAPRLTLMTSEMGLVIFLGFLISLWYSLRGKAPYLFIVLWYAIMLLPSILSPDQIPHNLRTIGATTPTYVFAAIFIVWLFETPWAIGRRWIQSWLGHTSFVWLARTAGVVLGLWLGWQLYQANKLPLDRYFYIFPQTDDAKAAYHVYAVEMAAEINHEPDADVAFILPRDTAAGDVFRNFTTDFLTELEQPPAAHYWVIDDERTLANDLAIAAAEHSIMRVVEWKTSKHTGADPKEVIPYYLEKYGHYSHSDFSEYFNIHTYQLETPAPDFNAAETLHPVDLNFDQFLKLTGYALGDAGNVDAVNSRQAGSNDLLWLRLAWRKTKVNPEDMKVSALIYTKDGQLVTQADKLLVNNILHVNTTEWKTGDEEETYFLISIPPATPPGNYVLRLAVYGVETLTRLPISDASGQVGEVDRVVTLANFAIMPAQKQPALDDFDLAFPARQELLPGLTLVGFESLPGETVRSGEQVKTSMIWQAGDTGVTENFSIYLVAKLGEDGQSDLDQDEWSLSEPVGLAGASYPTSRWQPDELLRGWLTARVPASFEPGLYQLSLRLTTANKSGQEVLTLPIGNFQVEGWLRNFDAPQPQIELGANYGGLVTLVGLDADTDTLSPGNTLTVRLYWRAEAEVEQNYTTFVQLIGPDGLLYGQVDQTPGAGEFPISGWLPGEYLTDPYAVSLAADAPSGDYQIVIGLYDPNTGERLPVSGLKCQSDACFIPSLTVP
jgi:hypothetical protein